ncbi:hypothetical protein HYU94_01640 [Candidatus Daviesbacteria bacterium]|nr:hypothetical protein [Candidatus Daviesbacteria bacterium]
MVEQPFFSETLGILFDPYRKRNDDIDEVTISLEALIPSRGTVEISEEWVDVFDPRPVYYVDIKREDSLLGATGVAAWIESRERQRRPRIQFPIGSAIHLGPASTRPINPQDLEEYQKVITEFQAVDVNNTQVTRSRKLDLC